jgi:hypothetical protein
MRASKEGTLLVFLALSSELVGTSSCKTLSELSSRFAPSGRGLRSSAEELRLRLRLGERSEDLADMTGERGCGSRRYLLEELFGLASVTGGPRDFVKSSCRLIGGGGLRRRDGFKSSVDEDGFRLSIEGDCPFFSFSSTMRWLTCRERFSFVARLVLGLLVVLSLLARVVPDPPLAVRAGGGGCSIHMTSALVSMRVTIGGWRSLMGGFDAE